MAPRLSRLWICGEEEEDSENEEQEDVQSTSRALVVPEPDMPSDSDDDDVPLGLTGLNKHARRKANRAPYSSFFGSVNTT